jgi:hypothetical protein
VRSSSLKFPVDGKTNKSVLRCAPSFLLRGCEGAAPPHPLYTVDSIARAIGKVEPSSQKATKTIDAAAAICELREEGYLNNEWRGLEEWKVTEVIRMGHHRTECLLGAIDSALPWSWHTQVAGLEVS